MEKERRKEGLGLSSSTSSHTSSLLSLVISTSFVGDTLGAECSPTAVNPSGDSTHPSGFSFLSSFQEASSFVPFSSVYEVFFIVIEAGNPPATVEGGKDVSHANGVERREGHDMEPFSLLSAEEATDGETGECTE